MRKRGRPKLYYGKLENKKRSIVNIEPLDLCLKKNIINDSQHKIGTRYKWLYTLRFGLPTISSVSVVSKENNNTKELKTHNEKWLKQREKEYNNIVNILKEIKLQKLVSKICIYNIEPLFLKIKRDHFLAQKELERFKFAMNELESFYKISFKNN